MKNFCLIISSLLFSFNLNSQIDYQISNFKIEISGTSTLQNWSATASSMTGTADMELVNGELYSLNNLSIKIDAESLKSDKGEMMENSMYNALKTNL